MRFPDYVNSTSVRLAYELNWFGKQYVYITNAVAVLSWQRFAVKEIIR